jgi:hypothetical protein
VQGNAARTWKVEAKMNHWIPFFVAIIWPVTLGIMLVVYRKRIGSILGLLEERLRKGAGIDILGVRVDASAETNAQSLSARPSNGPCGDSSNGINTGKESVALATAIFRGVCLEIRLNEEVADSMLGDLDNLLLGKGLIPLRRLNEKATAGFVQRPLVPFDDRRINLSWVYLQEITMFNRLVDSIDNPTAPDGYTRGRIIQALDLGKRVKKSGSELLAALAETREHHLS